MEQTTLQIRDAILEKAMPDVTFDGWTIAVFEKAAKELKIDDTTFKTAFPGEIIDIMDAFADKTDRDMLKALEKINIDDMRIRDRIHTALITRWETLTPNKEAVKASLKFWLNPLRKPRLAKIIWRTADHIWTWAGDTSTDYNRYSKRTLLSGIIGSGMLIWANDDTEDMQKTTAFVEARIENIMQFGKIIGKLRA